MSMEFRKPLRRSVRGSLYRSAARRSLHEAAEDLHEVGAMAPAVMAELDASCLTKLGRASRKVRGRAKWTSSVSIRPA